ncbi:hypothetical protein K502DRAFT_366245 [Neoconidiobolus thromboides FSU 785]|nr:hypothetical protein K502DRAFT_366245 [Neoconidiobolus thromboides FSU 785]
MEDNSYNKLPTTIDTVIIGNGPSSIFLSYLLSGFEAYYKPIKQTNRYIDDINPQLLSQLLKYQDVPLFNTQQSLLELTNIATNYFVDNNNNNNPLSSMLDFLLHPMADMEPEFPEMIHWKKKKSDKVDHIVLGKGQIGGVWGELNYSNMKALSIHPFLQLPGLSFEEYRNRMDMLDNEDRPIRSEVSSYFKYYVQYHRLENNFRNNIEVTQVINVKDVMNFKYCQCHNNNNNNEKCPKYGNYNYVIKGIIRSENNQKIEKFQMLCKNVVIASGVYNQPLSLNIPGLLDERVFYKVNELNNQINNNNNNNQLPALIIGSGLSAADAILELKKKNIPIIHFTYSLQHYKNKNKKHPLANCWKEDYPEYYSIYKTIKNNQDNNNIDNNYQLYHDITILSMKYNNDSIAVKFVNNSNKEYEIQVQLCGIFIGWEKTIPYLSGRLLNQLDENIISNLKTKSNQLNTKDNNSQLQGMFAIGSIVSSNFIRHLLVSCLIANAQIRQH